MIPSAVDVELVWSSRQRIELLALNGIMQSSPARWIVYRTDAGSNDVSHLASEGGKLCIRDDEGNELSLAFPKGRDRPAGMFPPLCAGAKCLVGFLKVSVVLRLSVAYGAGESLDPTDVRGLAVALGREELYPVLEDLSFDIGLVPRAFRLRQIPPVSGANSDLLL